MTTHKATVKVYSSSKEGVRVLGCEIIQAVDVKDAKRQATFILNDYATYSPDVDCANVYVCDYPDTANRNSWVSYVPPAEPSKMTKDEALQELTRLHTEFTEVSNKIAKDLGLKENEDWKEVKYQVWGGLNSCWNIVKGKVE